MIIEIKDLHKVNRDAAILRGEADLDESNESMVKDKCENNPSRDLFHGKPLYKIKDKKPEVLPFNNNQNESSE